MSTKGKNNFVEQLVHLHHCLPWLSFCPDTVPAVHRMWLSFYLKTLWKRRQVLKLIDELYSPSSSLHLRRVVFASPHRHATHTAMGVVDQSQSCKADCESADKLLSLIKSSVFLCKAALILFQYCTGPRQSGRELGENI